MTERCTSPSISWTRRASVRYVCDMSAVGTELSDWQSGDRSRQERPPLRREKRIREILEHRVRTVFRNRDKTYELRGSEIHLLSEVGKFRLAAQNDLAEFAFVEGFFRKSVEPARSKSSFATVASKPEKQESLLLKTSCIATDCRYASHA